MATNMGTSNALGEGLFGSANTSSEDRKAREALEKAVAEFTSIQQPDLKDLDLLAMYDKLGGDFKPTASVYAPTIDGGDDVVYEGVDPRLAELSLQGDSAFNDISIDPRLKDTQMGSLDALREIAESGGMTAQDEANLNRVLSDTAAADRGRRGAIQQGMASRGMGGSGMELLQLLDSSQAATDQANQSGLEIAGMAEQRAMDAMLKGGSLAGDIRGQDFGEEATVAEANDAIDRFNTGNMNQNSQFNAGAANNMAQFNAGNVLQNAQFNKGNELDVKKINAGSAYDAQKTNAGYANDAQAQSWQTKQGLGADQTKYNTYTLPQQKFDNQMDIAKGKATAYGAIQDNWKEAAARKEAESAGNKQMAVLLGAAAIGASDKRVKKDIKPIKDDEINEFLDAVGGGNTFKYKKPGSLGQKGGERAGFLLDNVADTKLGKMITKVGPDGTKYYDKDNLDGVILAALSSMSRGDKAS